MNRNVLVGAVLVAAGLVAGILVSKLPAAFAATTSGATDLEHRKFMVSIDEIRQNFVFNHDFTGRYSKTVTMSDGTKRHIELVPMVHNGVQVIELKDNTGHTYMGLDGTTTNGKLMVQVRDFATMQQRLRTEGWPPTGR